MRANTKQIYELMSRGAFLSVDSTDTEVKHLYDDIEENFGDYECYFAELGLQLTAGDGYFYFSRPSEARLTIEEKLQSFAQWVDKLDFLKTYDIAFSTGFMFRSTNILERMSLDVELRDKAGRLYRKENTNQEIVSKLIKELVSMKFVDMVSEEDDTYKVTAAFRYAEDMVNLMMIYNEEEVPEV